MKNIITYLPTMSRLAVPVACCAFFASADQEFGADEDQLVDEMYQEEVVAQPDGEVIVQEEVVAQPEESTTTTTTTTTTTAKPKPPKPTGGVVNRTVAIVNGRAITSQELKYRFYPVFRELLALHPAQGNELTNAIADAKAKILEELIERELVIAEFENNGYLMGEQDIDAEINNRVLNQFGGKRKLLNEYLERTGQTFSSYRKEIRKELMVGAMRSARYEQHTPPTPEEIQQEYNRTKRDYRNTSEDKIKFKKIFVKMQVLVEDPIEESAQNVRANFAEAARLKRAIEQGDITFEDAAKRYSADAHAKDGGVWPLTARNDLAPEFAAIIFGAKIGKLVGPIIDSTGQGFTIAQSMRVVESAPPPLSNPEVREKVTDSVLRRKSARNYNRWVQRLRDKAKIRYIK